MRANHSGSFKVSGWKYLCELITLLFLTVYCSSAYYAEGLIEEESSGTVVSDSGQGSWTDIDVSYTDGSGVKPLDGGEDKTASGGQTSGTGSSTSEGDQAAIISSNAASGGQTAKTGSNAASGGQTSGTGSSTSESDQAAIISSNAASGGQTAKTGSNAAADGQNADAGNTGVDSRKKDDKSDDSELDQIISDMMEDMTLEEKVLQMFVISPEALTGVSGVTMAGETTQAAINNTPVGGLLYMENNLYSAEQITQMLANTQQYSMERIGVPMFLCVDEEGGTVRRINGRGIVEGDAIPSMSAVGSEEEARRYGSQMGRYLSLLGFNVDFAPVADTMTNPNNQVVRERSFGSDPNEVASMAVAVMEGLHESNVASTFKHFPGHGSTAEDTHAGSGVSYQGMDDLLACDLVPFQAGVDNGTEMIMVGHISLPEVTGDSTPATLSYEIITGILRDTMGYDGLVITDALSMGAISQSYSSADAAVKAVQAGNDLLLYPADFSSARYGVMDAVQNGSISMERIDESVERILRLKVGLMMGMQDAG